MFLKRMGKLIYLATGILLYLSVPWHNGVEPFSIECYAQLKNSDVEQEPLRLTTTILSQRYCKENDEFDTLKISLSLRYTNIGRDRLILYKESNLIYRVMVSNTLEDAAARRFVLDNVLTIYTEESNKTSIINDRIPDKSFVILPPGRSYITTSGVYIAAIRKGGNFPGTLRPGNYILQVKVYTWPKPKEVAEKIRLNWRPSGNLWSESILSAPMMFKVKEQRLVVNCQ